MRKTALLFILCSTVCLAVSSTAQTVHLLVPFTDFGIRSNIVRSVICTPVSRTTVSDSLIRFPEPRTIAINTYPAITNGSVTFSNQLSGYAYRFDFSTLMATYAITSNIGTNLTGLVNVADYTAVSTNLAAGIYAYSQAQSDARYPTFATATNIALAVAQSVVNTNAGGSGGVTNGGGILAGMLTNASFSAEGSNTVNTLALTQAKSIGVSNSTVANFTPYTPVIKATNSTLFPFLNSTNWVYSNALCAYVQNGSQDPTNYFFYDAVYFGTWVFASTLRITNDADVRVFLRDNSGSGALGFSDVFFTSDSETQDSMRLGAFFSGTNYTSMSVNDSGVSFFNGVEIGESPVLVVSNLTHRTPLIKIYQATALSGVFGAFEMYSLPFGAPYTNGLMQGYEGAKIVGRIFGSPRDDNRFFGFAPYYLGEIGQFGGGLDIIFSMPTNWGTANNPAATWLNFGGWRYIRSLNANFSGVEIGDTKLADHLRGAFLPAWATIVSSTNDRPFILMTNQQPSGNKQFLGTLPAGSLWTDNTNTFIGGKIYANTVPVVTESSLGYSRFYFATNDFTVTNIVITNHVGYCITAPITNNGMYEIEVNAIARGNQSTDRPYIITWITNNVAMGFVFTSRAFNGNGYAGWSSGFEQGAPTPGFILATNTSGLDTFLGNRPISENRPVSGTAQSSTANHIITLRLTNAPINLFMSCSASATGTNVLKAGSYIKVTRIE